MPSATNHFVGATNPKPRPAMYFAFGSNMDERQMRARCPGLHRIGPAVLPKHKLIFTGHSATWGGAVASVVKARGHSVPGVMYWIPSEDWERLDSFEGAPWVYRRSEYDVIWQSYRVPAQVYLHNDPEAQGPPSWRYLVQIHRAYKQWGFDATKLMRHAALA